MRRDSRADANQSEIVEFARACGATIQHLHMVGDGCPDLLIGYLGLNDLWEIKVPGANLSKRKRGKSRSQVEWHQDWRGSACVIRTVEDATERLDWMRRSLGLSAQTDQ